MATPGPHATTDHSRDPRRAAPTGLAVTAAGALVVGTSCHPSVRPTALES